MLINTYTFIAFKGLDIKNMLRNHHLAKSIEYAAWGELTNNIVYKAESAGKTYMKANLWNTSKTCSVCVV